jgi:hypothetical protein
MSALCVEGINASQLAGQQLEPLIVAGEEGQEQRKRLRRVSMLIRDRGFLIAAVACRRSAADLRIDEVALAKGAGGELPEEIVDVLETIAVVGGCERIILVSASRAIRRAVRLLGYVPQRRGKRLYFVRQVMLPDSRQSGTCVMRHGASERSQ